MSTPDIVLAIISGVASLLLGGWFTFWTLSKRMSYTLSEPRPLLASIKDHARGDLSVLVRGQKIDNPVVLDMHIRNAGAREILHSDVEEPLTVTVQGALVCSAACDESGRAKVDGWIRSEPGDGEDASTASSDVLLTMGTMNRRERFVLSLLLEGEPAGVTAKCRIQGQTSSTLKNTAEQGPVRKALGDIGTAVFALAIIVVAFAYFYSEMDSLIFALIATVAMAVFMITVLGTLMYIGSRIMPFIERWDANRP